MTIELTAAEMAFSLCVEADRMEENGDLLCFDVRAAACLVDQFTEPIQKRRRIGTSTR